MRLLGLTLVVLGFALIWRYQTVGEVEQKRPIHRSIESSWTPVPPTIPVIEELSVIVERPLFVAQRMVAVPKAPEPELIPPPRVRLSAVSISNQVRIAVIQDLEGDATRRVREGDLLEQWIVEKVDRDRVILRAKQQKIIIPLFSTQLPATVTP